MEILIGMLVLAGVMAFIMECVDASLGMGYGTVLSPVLIIMGFSPLLVVPSILLSQAAGGFTASLFHHKFKNVEFCRRSKDSLIVYIITLSGVAATVIAALIAVSIPKVYLNTYIGLLVAIMGIILASSITFRFTWKRMVGVGVISSFNKGMSGGGFGPVVTGGQMIAGQNHKNAIGCTTAAEAPICIAGFLIYLLFNGIANWWLPLVLFAGAALAAPIGAFTTSKMESGRFKRILGLLIMVLGIWTLWKTYM
ncbi:MAG: hypothetical protein DRO99_00250 [Candidatus Aenigmatarchaeota archaeon]|nr:MAG: hypothetical protein DRO99_00250 [Candidatus Aenigmarchaeota archaeon]